MKILIDECLHTSLVSVAHSAGHTADHVAHRGLGGLKDWQLMQVILLLSKVWQRKSRAKRVTTSRGRLRAGSDPVATLALGFALSCGRSTQES